MAVDRKKFYCIQEFDLVSQTKIVFNDKGVFEAEKDASWMKDEPYTQVTDYMIRSAFHSAIDTTKGSREKIFSNMTKDDDTLLDEIMNDGKRDIGKWRQTEPKSIFNFTKFDPFYVYKWFHPKIWDEFKTRYKTSNHGKDPPELKYDKLVPECFQVVMVASDMLALMFKEDCLKNDLRKSIQKNAADYLRAYGTFEKALENAPYLEQVCGSLPVSDKVPITVFRLVVNNKLAAIASFFALAIYDQQSFHLARVLLIDGAMKSGETITLEVELFGRHLKDEDRIRPDKDRCLFPVDMGVDSTNFITNLVDVLNEFATCVPTDSPEMKKKETGAQTRMAHHQFRTLASDLVEIYVSHGLCPRYILASCKQDHPLLSTWIKNDKKVWPLRLILKYIMLAIQNGQITVGASHTYTGSKKTRRLEIFNSTKENESEKNAKKKKRRPLSRDIRLLYKLTDAALIDSTKESEKWLKLPEVVNVILFSLRNPWIKNLTEKKVIHWSPTFHTDTLKKMEKGREVVPKTKKKGAKMTVEATATEAETEPEARKGAEMTMEATANVTNTDPTASKATTTEARKGAETEQRTSKDTTTEKRKGEKEKGETVTRAKAKRADTASKETTSTAAAEKTIRKGERKEEQIDDSYEVTTEKGEGESSSIVLGHFARSLFYFSDDSEFDDDKDVRVDETSTDLNVNSSVTAAEEGMWQNFLVTAETNMVAMLDNGQGEVRERYLEYLDTIHNLGISTCYFVAMQRKMLVDQEDLLSMGEPLDVDTEYMAENLTKKLQEEKPDATWHKCPLRVKRALDAAAVGTLTYLSKYGRGGVTHASAITAPVQPPSVQPSDLDDGAAKPESSKKRKRKEEDERKPAATEKPAATPTKWSKRIMERRERGKGEGETPTKE